MKLTKEETARAFSEALAPHAIDTEGPEHRFSDRFERNMDRLLTDRAACRPRIVFTWKKAASAVFALMLAAALSVIVFSSHDKTAGFHTERCEGYDEVIFDTTDKTTLEREYRITKVPEGFTLTRDLRMSEDELYLQYRNTAGNSITLTQFVPGSASITVDNERCSITSIRVDGQTLLLSLQENGSGYLAWAYDGYGFWLSSDFPLGREGFLDLYRSVK